MIYKELVEVVKANPKALDPPVFFNWVRDNYIVTICLGLRRLSDHRLDSISIRRLLEEVALRPKILSRIRYRALHCRRGLSKADADVSFDKIVGKTQRHIAKRVVKQDIAVLKKVDERIRLLVNKRLAHHAPLNEIRRFPTIKEIENALEVFDQLLAKYNMLITGKGPVSLYSYPRYEWRKVLQIPWMSTDPLQRPPRYRGPRHVNM